MLPHVFILFHWKANARYSIRIVSNHNFEDSFLPLVRIRQLHEITSPTCSRLQHHYYNGRLVHAGKSHNAEFVVAPQQPAFFVNTNAEMCTKLCLKHAPLEH